MKPTRHRTDGVHVDTTDLTSARLDEHRDRTAVIRRLRVGHRAHRGENHPTRPRRTPSLSSPSLFARLSQVRVEIDEPRRDDLAARIAHERSSWRREALADTRDATLLDDHVELVIHALPRVNQPAAANVERVHDQVPSVPRGARVGGARRHRAW